jgi:Zn-dependent protease
VLAIAALIAWTLAGFVLPELEPGYNTASYWLIGVLVACIFFASLLAHELGHSLIARRHGIPVDEITLWLLGGVSKLGADSKTAGDEFRMAVVGPLISLGLGLAFGLLAGFAALVNTPGLLVAGLVWLSATNLLLGVFNLIPAFPLDGGRILRSILWHRTGDRVRATQSAARAGQITGYVLIALGVAEFLFGALTGLWLVLLGWFVSKAAQNEAALVTQQALLADVKVRDIMSPDPVTVPAGLMVDELIDRYVLGSRHSAYPVVGVDGQPVGLVTLASIRGVPAPQRSAVAVASAMHKLADVVVASPDDTVNAVLGRMLPAQARRALVVENGRLVGVVSMTDVARALEARSLVVPTGRASTVGEAIFSQHPNPGPAPREGAHP